MTAVGLEFHEDKRQAKSRVWHWTDQCHTGLTLVHITVILVPLWLLFLVSNSPCWFQVSLYISHVESGINMSIFNPCMLACSGCNQWCQESINNTFHLFWKLLGVGKSASTMSSCFYVMDITPVWYPDGWYSPPFIHASISLLWTFSLFGGLIVNYWNINGGWHLEICRWK